jgi:GNAT superfamily N-acetyltransferase
VVEVIIREATREDILTIVEVRRASTTEEETIGFTAIEWGTFLDVKKLRAEWTTGNRMKDDYEVIVSEKGGQIVGYLVFKREQEHLYIDAVHVRKSEQRKGVGKALLVYLERLAIDIGFKRIETETVENAHGVPWISYDFWIKMGFGDTGERLETEWDFKMIPFVKQVN